MARVSRRYVYALVGAVALAGSFLFAGPVSGQSTSDGQSDHPLVDGLLREALGDAYSITRVVPVATDAADDSTNYAGEAVATPLGILGADWLEFGYEDEGFFEYVCNEYGPTFAVEVTCPLDLALFEAANEFMFVYALTGGVVEPDSFLQFVFAWAEPALAPYEGAPGDPNTGRNRSKDLYRVSPGEQLQLGETSYSAGTFSFDPDNQGVIAVYGQDMIAMLIPRGEFVQQCLNVAVALITERGVVDLVELSDTPHGTVLAEPPVEDDEPSEEPSESNTTEAPPTQPTEAESTGEAVEEEDTTSEQEVDEEAVEAPSGLGGFGFLWALAGIAAIGLVGWGTRTITKRRSLPVSGPCPEELRLSNEAQEAWEKATDATKETGQRLHGIELPLGPIRTDLDNAADLAPRPDEYESSEDYERARAEHDARVAELRRQFDALEEERAVADAAYQEALENERSAYENYRAARDAYLDCVGEERETPEQLPTPADASTAAPTETSTPGVVSGTGAGTTGTSPRPVADPGSTTSKREDGCKGEWRKDKSGPTHKVLGKTVRMTVSRSTQRLRLWFEAHGTLLEGDATNDALGEPATGEFKIQHLAKFADRKAQPLVDPGRRNYDVEITITIDQTEQYPTCMRWWDCDPDGNLVPTDRVMLGDRQVVPAEENTFVFRAQAANAVEAATRLSQAYNLVASMQAGERQIEAWETENCF